MVSVTARKIRNHGRERASLGVGRTYAGYLISYPSVGRGMVIFRDPNGHRMVTTPVKRVLGDPGGEKLYVEACRLAGQVAILSRGLLPPVFPAYVHNDPRKSFDHVLHFIAQAVEEGVPDTVRRFAFEQDDEAFRLTADPAQLEIFDPIP